MVSGAASVHLTPAAHREAAAYLQSTYEMSERRACRVIGVDRASVRYQATRPDDGVLRERLKALAQERRRFGYRRLHGLLRREGQVVNRKWTQRTCRGERQTVPRRPQMRERLAPADGDRADRQVTARLIEFTCQSPSGDEAELRNGFSARPCDAATAPRLAGIELWADKGSPPASGDRERRCEGGVTHFPNLPNCWLCQAALEPPSAPRTSSPASLRISRRRLPTPCPDAWGWACRWARWRRCSP